MGTFPWPSTLRPQQVTVPPQRTPQVCSPPALTWVKVPAGGMVSPWSLKPQQATVPSPLTPQVWMLPALTSVKVLPGGLAWHSLMRPQQTTVPSLMTAQVWAVPALIWTAPTCGELCEWVSDMSSARAADGPPPHPGPTTSAASSTAPNPSQHRIPSLPITRDCGASPSRHCTGAPLIGDTTR